MTSVDLIILLHCELTLCKSVSAEVSMFDAEESTLWNSSLSSSALAANFGRLIRGDAVQGPEKHSKITV